LTHPNFAHYFFACIIDFIQRSGKKVKSKAAPDVKNPDQKAFTLSIKQLVKTKRKIKDSFN